MRNASGTPLTGTGACGTTSSLGNTGADGSFNVAGTIELVKTGTISGGTIQPTASGGIYYSGVLNTGVPLNNSSNTLSIASGTPVRQVTCSVSSLSANQTIPMATVNPSMFPGSGSVAAKTPFSIALICDANVGVAVTFVSATGNSGIASVLASGGTATGVGVQLLNASGAPITLGDPLQLTSGTVANPTFNFFAQYWRLGSAPVTSGSVNASTIFTMSYQ
ncbi:fimbrial protein [Paraburkholderia sp. MPAMCS5]|uniref:fimbrial protein n=1 Tax=Paraburkholderia sp. MPAMCS5 TaxID=3112563 RepID=UPI002E17DBEF|nr:fimbrial protein [Paraburkholderia sp. MPAMCS5]